MKRTPLHDPLAVETLRQAADVLRVLAHPQRLQLVDLLMLADGRGEPLSVGELAEATNLAPAAVSQHLNQMRARGIVDADREGRTAYYHVISPHAQQLLACIREHAQPPASAHSHSGERTNAAPRRRRSP